MRPGNIANTPAALLSEKAELWLVASESQAHHNKVWMVNVLPDGQALCSCPAGSLGKLCKHVRRVRAERGDPQVMPSPVTVHAFGRKKEPAMEKEITPTTPFSEYPKTDENCITADIPAEQIEAEREREQEAAEAEYYDYHLTPSEFESEVG